MAKRRRNIAGLLISLLFAVSAGAFSAAPAMDAASRLMQNQMITNTLTSLSKVDQTRIQEEIEKSIKYNELVYQDQQMGKYGYLGSSATDDTYDSLWQFDSAGTICTIDIPTVNIKLPVLHGTNSNDLQYAAGHMYGSSIPVGGENTKAVIAAHTGLASASLFTDLDRMQMGDEFFIHIGATVHAYTVTDIAIAPKGEEKEELKISKAKYKIK